MKRQVLLAAVAAALLPPGWSLAAQQRAHVVAPVPPAPSPMPSPPPAPSPPTPFSAHPDPMDDGCYREPSAERADLCAYWRSALAAEAAAGSSATANRIAIASAILSTLGIVGLLVTLNLTRKANALSRRSADAAEAAMLDGRRIGQAQARCYLSIEAVRVHVGAADGKPRLHVAIRNSGASPALETTWAARISYEVGIGGGLRRDEWRSADLVRAAIAPDGVFDVPAVTLDFPIDDAERAVLVTADGWITMSASISLAATDVFDLSVATEDSFAGTIHDLDVWFALEATGAAPVRSIVDPATPDVAANGSAGPAPPSRRWWQRG